MTDLSKPGIHPDADALSAFAEHRLPAHERDQVLGHLAVCAACREILALSSAAAPQSVPPVPEQKLPWTWGLRWALSAGVLAVVTLVFMVGFYRTSRVRMAGIESDKVAVSHPAAPSPEELSHDMSPPSGPQRSAAPPLDKTQAPGQTQSVPTQQAKPLASELKESPQETRTDQSAVVSKDAPAAKPELSSRNSATISGISAGALAPSAPSNAPISNRAMSALAKAAPVEVSGQATASLPSGKPTLSLAISQARAIAIDTANQVFVSSDAGQTWKPVVTSWMGHAVKAQLVSSISKNSIFDALQRDIQKTESSAAAPKPDLDRQQADAKLKENGIVRGTVSDLSGAVVQGATVTVTEEDKPQVRSEVSDAQGHFVIEDLPPGKYDIKTQAPGFQPQVQNGIQVSSDRPSEANPTLAVAAANETVTVVASQSVLQTEPFAAQSRKKFEAGQPGKSEAFQITTDTGEVWVSYDGLNWRRRPQ